MAELTMTVAMDMESDDDWVELWLERDGHVDIWADVANDRTVKRVCIRISPKVTGDDWDFDLVEVQDLPARAHRRALELVGLPADDAAQPRDG